MEQWTGRILAAAIIIVAALGLWALGIRTNKRVLKIWAVTLVAIPLLAVIVGFAVQFTGTSNPPFRTTAVGPARKEGAVTRDLPFWVNDASLVQAIELTPRARMGESPSAPVTVAFTVRSPQKTVLAQGRESVAPSQNQFWSAIRAQFQPAEGGEHMLSIEIPDPVGEVQVFVRELRK